MKNKILLFAIILLLAILSGCAQEVKCNVSMSITNNADVPLFVNSVRLFENAYYNGNKCSGDVVASISVNKTIPVRGTETINGILAYETTDDDSYVNYLRIDCSYQTGNTIGYP